MVKLEEFNADSLENKIYRKKEEIAEDGLRPHLGASIIGKACMRAIWYQWRWAKDIKHEGRLLYLFERGQNEEAVFVQKLKSVDVEVVEIDPRTGEQFKFCIHGHFGGSMDGCGRHVPTPDGFVSDKWHVLEFKTHNDKSFNKLQKDGVFKSKPEHYYQMQCYMGFTGMERALYCAVCKNDDRLYFERVKFKKTEYDAMLDKAVLILNSHEPPAKISENPETFECKWCDYLDVCQYSIDMRKSCRTCVYARPDPHGEWDCHNKFGCTSIGCDNGKIDLEHQKQGCSEYVKIALRGSL